MAFQKTRLYNIWDNMRQRCTNPNKPCYKNYGAKGITVCPDWNNFKQFQEWALQNGYNNSLTLERKDNAKGYNPDNCTWIPKGQQTYNRAVNNWFTMDGETLTLTQWARRYNIPPETVMRHLRKGTDLEYYFKNADKRLSYNRNQVRK